MFTNSTCHALSLKEIPLRARNCFLTASRTIGLQASNAIRSACALLGRPGWGEGFFRCYLDVGDVTVADIPDALESKLPEAVVRFILTVTPHPFLSVAHELDLPVAIKKLNTLLGT